VQLDDGFKIAINYCSRSVVLDLTEVIGVHFSVGGKRISRLCGLTFELTGERKQAMAGRESTMSLLGCSGQTLPAVARPVE
jgi:hypothetical protein